MIENLRKTFLDLRPFLLTMTLFWVAGGILLILYGYEESFLIINRIHFPVLDHGALFFTHFADVLVLITLIFLLMWIKDPALPISAIIVVIGTGLAVIVLKQWVFPHWDRPTVVLADHPEAVFLPAHPPSRNSFPSGHATSFLAGGLIYAWFVRKWHWVFQVGVGLISIGFSFTRVILGVHFFGDIYAGSLLGTGLGILLLSISYFPIQEKIAQKGGERLKKWSPVLLGIFFVLLIIRFYFLWYVPS